MISAQKAKSIADQIYPQKKNHILPDGSRTEYENVLQWVSKSIEEQACAGNLDIAMMIGYDFNMAYYILRELEGCGYKVSIANQIGWSGSGEYTLLVKWE